MDACFATSDGAAIGRETPGVTWVDSFFWGGEKIFFCLKCRLKVKVIMIFWIRGIIKWSAFFFGGE